MTSVDPTAFVIDFDPTVQLMRGRAIHGDTPFDVPFISRITDSSTSSDGLADLWSGGCQNGLVLPSHIENLVSLYPWERYTIRHELKSEAYVRAFDSAYENYDQFIAVARWVNECRKTGVTLVHCQAGLNRSSLVAGLALVLDGMDPEDAINLIREKRSPACLCNRSFEVWLLTQ